MSTETRPSGLMLVCGTVIFALTLAAWLAGEWLGRRTDQVWLFSTPIVMALIVYTPLSNAAGAARSAANQTNGALDARMRNAVAEGISGLVASLPMASEAGSSSALAKRDAARTRQAVGDIAAEATGRVEADPHRRPSGLP